MGFTGPYAPSTRAATAVTALPAGLIARCRDLDEDAWTTLFNLFRRLIIGVAGRWGFFGAEAEDVLSETFIRFFKVIDRMEETGAVGYLSHIAHSVCKDLLRKRKTLKRGEGEITASLEALAETGFEPTRPDDSNEMDDEDEERLKLLWTIIDGLDPDDRELILDRYIRDKDFDSIAAARKVRKNTLVVRTHRLLKRIRIEAHAQLDQLSESLNP